MISVEKLEKMKLKFFLILIFIHLALLNSFAQKRLKTYDDYINKYSYIAVNHMHKYKIPASISIAQGLLESGAGMSELTRRSNNHFGIKCHRDWTGGRVYAKDDTPNDCFRKYNSAEESYEDHARFLVNGTRYRHLFSLSTTDYKGWARGLQKSGYATDIAYANKLIKLIEDYELYNYDKVNTKRKSGKAIDTEIQTSQNAWKHQPFKTHGLVYVVATNNDTYESIATEFNFNPKDLYKYNEVPKGFPLIEGDIVYFQKKKSRADKPYYEHVVQIGESMHSISQKYGVKVKNLYKMNKQNYEYVPIEGDILRLR